MQPTVTIEPFDRYVEPIAVLTTKLTQPLPRTAVVRRSRLTDRLRHADGRKLSLVVAPAGWGKSSLLVEWCSGLPFGRIAWVSLDARDNDPPRFLLYLITALDRVEPGLGSDGLRLLQSPARPPIETVLTAVLNNVAASEQTLTLVLDDYHVIQSAEVHRAMSFIVDNLPPMLHLVIASRTEPPLSLARLRARGHLTELTTRDLRFTCDESKLFFDHVMQLALSDSAVARLQQRTEGWIAGLQLAGLSLHTSRPVDEFIESFSGNHRFIVDYLVDEVLSGQPEDVQRFLRETSILSRLNGSLCDAVTAGNGGQAMLEYLDASNLFVIALDDDRQWYRYHHLFAEVLHSRMESGSPTVAPQLHARASEWFAQRDMGDDAVTHAIAACDSRRAADLMEKYARVYWTAGDIATLERWLDAVPKELIRERLMLSLVRAQCHLVSNRPEDAMAIVDAFDSSAPPDNAQVYGELLATQAHLARVSGENAKSLDVSRKALEFLPENEQAARGCVYVNIAYLELMRGNVMEARAALESAAACARLTTDVHVDWLARHATGEFHEQLGELRAAEKAYSGLIGDLRKDGAEGVVEGVLASAGLSRVLYEWNDLDAAEAAVDRDAIGRMNVFGVQAATAMALVDCARGDHQSARKVVADFADSIRGTRVQWAVRILDAHRVLLSHNDQVTYEPWIEKISQIEAAGDTDVFDINHCTLLLEDGTWSRIMLSRGDYDAVIRRIKPKLEKIVASERHGLAMPLRTALAAAYCGAGDVHAAADVLEPAVILAEREGYVRVFVDIGAVLCEPLRLLAQRGTAPLTVARLLDAIGVAPELPHDSPLTERETEVLRLVAAGLSNPEIATQLFLSVGTIKRHVYNIYAKLDAGGRVDAIARARRLGLLSQ